jgi:DNA primase
VAGRIRDEDIKLVRDASAIDAVVEEHLQLRNAGGGNLKGLCPFHDEKSASFQVTPARGLFYCFGCGAGGDVIDFVTRIDHLSFTEAVERLAARAGITLRYIEGGYTNLGQQGARTRLVEAHRAATAFYVEQLATPEALAGRTFLAERGFDKAAAERFRVGYAPAGWDALVRHLRGRGFTDKELLDGGLASQGRRGPVDRLRGRLIWPICDITGDVVGFGARRLDAERDNGPKYLNTPETSIFKKSTLLYGLEAAKREIAKSSQAVVVEGYTDVMACHLAGVGTAVATCGTSFGEDHIKILRRLLMDHSEFRGEVIFTFDGDAAGRKAALRAFDEEQRFVTQTFVAVESGGMDPCELRLARGDAAVRELVASRVPLFEFAIRERIGGYDLTTSEGRVAALDAAAPVVAKIKDHALRHAYAVRLDSWLGFLDEKFVVERVATVARRSGKRGGRPEPRLPGQAAAASPGPTGAAVASQPDPRDPRYRVEREVLKIALQQPVLAGPVFDALAPEEFTEPRYAVVREAIAAAGGVSGVSVPESWIGQVLDASPDDQVRALVTQLAVDTLHARGAPDHFYVGAQLARLRELSVGRRIHEVKSRLQRMNPNTEPDAYNKLAGELFALEGYRSNLRAKGAEAL